MAQPSISPAAAVSEASVAVVSGRRRSSAAQRNETRSALSATQREMTDIAATLRVWRAHPGLGRPPVLIEPQSAALRALRPIDASLRSGPTPTFDPFLHAVDPRSLNTLRLQDLRELFQGARCDLLRGLHPDSVPHGQTPRSVVLLEAYHRYDRLLLSCGLGERVSETLARVQEDLDVTEHGALSNAFLEDVDRHEELLFAGIEALEQQKKHLKMAEEARQLGRVAAWALVLLAAYLVVVALPKR